MSGSKEAAEKRRKTLIAKYGSLEAWKVEQRKWGSKGGKKSTSQGAGFGAMTHEQRSEAGKKGYQAMIKKAGKR